MCCCACRRDAARRCGRLGATPRGGVVWNRSTNNLRDRREAETAPRCVHRPGAQGGRGRTPADPYGTARAGPSTGLPTYKNSKKRNCVKVQVPRRSNVKPSSRSANRRLSARTPGSGDAHEDDTFGVNTYNYHFRHRTPLEGMELSVALPVPSRIGCWLTLGVHAAMWLHPRRCRVKLPGAHAAMWLLSLCQRRSNSRTRRSPPSSSSGAPSSRPSGSPRRP